MFWRVISIPINLRINVDLDNHDEAWQVLRMLKERSLIADVVPYLGHVTSYSESYREDRCLSTKEYSKSDLQFMKDVGRPLIDIYPKPRGNYCIANQVNGWVIDSLGDMYKCYVDIGKEERKVFSLTKEGDLTSVFNDYMLFDDTKNPKCTDCKFFPICLGGCPHKRLHNTRDCSYFKHNLSEYLTECAAVLMEESN